MGQSRTLPPRMQNMYQRSHSWNGGGQPWQRPSSSSSSPGVTGERPQHHYQPHRERGERSERVEREQRTQGTPAVHVLPPRMRAVKAPRHQSNTAIEPNFGLVAPPSPPSPSDPLGLGRNLDQLNAARPSIARSYNEVNTSYPPLLNIPSPSSNSSVLYATGMDNQRTSQLSPEAPVFQPRFGMPASAPLYHSSNVDEFPFPFVGGGGGGGSSSTGYQGGDVVGNIGDMTMSDPALGVSFISSSPSTSPTRTSPTGSPPKMTKLPPIAPPPMTKPDDNTPPPPAYLVNFLASKFGPSSNTTAAAPAPASVATPIQEEPSMVLYDSALSSAATITLPVSTVVVPGVTPKMVPSSSSTMSLVPTVPILKLPTPPNKRSSPSSSTSSTPRPAPSPPVSTTPKKITEVAPRRPSAPSRSSYIVADMLLNRIRSSPLRPGLGPRRATSPASSGGSTSPISRSCLSKEVMMDDVVMLSLPVSS